MIYGYLAIVSKHCNNKVMNSKVTTATPDGNIKTQNKTNFFSSELTICWENVTSSFKQPSVQT